MFDFSHFIIAVTLACTISWLQKFCTMMTCFYFVASIFLVENLH